jgi:pimeloyl-ACP methyl ester carboxylesterase
MKVEIQGLDINYIQEGQGQDVLLLHGWGGSIETMVPIVNILKNSFRVTALDLPGFGESSKPEEIIDSYGYAKIIKEFIDKTGLEKIILFGHSHGGRISIILSSMYNNLFSKVVLIDSAGIIPKRTANYYIKVYSFKLMKKIYLAFIPKNRRREVLERFYKKHGSADYKDADGIMRKIMVKVVNDNLRPHLKDIKVPVLLFWGEKDDATPLYMARIMEKEIPDAGLVVVEGAGHYSYVDDFNTFKVVINSFLAKNN